MHKETFDLLVGQYQLREEWSYVIIMYGELSAMILGELMMLLLCADNLDFPQLVSYSPILHNPVLMLL